MGTTGKMRAYVARLAQYVRLRPRDDAEHATACMLAHVDRVDRACSKWVWRLGEAYAEGTEMGS